MMSHAKPVNLIGCFCHMGSLNKRALGKTEIHNDPFQLQVRMTHLVKLNTNLHADSVEWCPSEGLEEILACGTYQLNELSKIREGSFSLFRWNNDTLCRILGEETEAVVSGVLDMKWKPLTETCILSAATASGVVRIFQLKLEENLNLKDLGSKEPAIDDSLKERLCLSLDWAKPTSPSVVATSDSLGQIGVMELDPTGLRLVKNWQAHRYEAWIVCFGHSSNDLFSGGDDCMLHRWDQRRAADKPVATTKWHKMGVCSLQMHPTDENILASGRGEVSTGFLYHPSLSFNYDEHLVLWDIRNMSMPLKSASLGGGVWRIKWNMALPNLVAAACMHNHFSIVDTHPATSDPMDVQSLYKEHKSLAYGIDWCRKHERTFENEREVFKFVLASCSFYDNSLHIWKTSVST